MSIYRYTCTGANIPPLSHHVPPWKPPAQALMFIDKYTQVPRILTPLVLVLGELPLLCRDPGLRKYVEETFGSVDECRWGSARFT
jgi:hypothetical protein